MLNLEWYRIFLYTAREGNLTRAAQLLYITQPSVSYAIKQLEQALDTKLFDRMSKGVRLTAEGKALLDYVEQSFALLDAAENRLAVLKRLEGGEIRIGASDSLIKHYLLPHLNMFHARYPHIRIKLSHGKTAEIVQRLHEGQIDCGIVRTPVTQPELLIQPLGPIEDCFVAGGVVYKRMAEQPITVGELAKLPLLLLSPGSSTRRFVERWFAMHGEAVEPDIELASIELLIEFARQGFGVAFMTRAFVAEQLASGELVELRLTAEIAPRSIGLAVRRDISLSAATAQFLALLSEESVR